MDYEDAKNLAETIALGSGAIFFLYKAAIGYFFVDLCLSVCSERDHSEDDDSDILVITARLKKGSRGSIRIHDMQARLTINKDVQTIPFIGFHRNSYTTVPITSSKRKIVNWNIASKSSPLLRLPPDEEAVFSCFARIPRNEICVVEVAVLGQERPWVGVRQWKASHISIPLRATK